MSLFASAATKGFKWNAADYAANSTVQQSWARELIARLNLRGDEHILDVGCGDGKVTADLARAVPRGLVFGVDASAEMIAFAKKAFPAGKNSNLKFQIADARKISLKIKCDLVFSNSALHWVDNHEKFLSGAASVLKPGGRLVVSCGVKGNAHDVFLALRPEMRLKRWRNFFRRMPMPYFFYAPGDYQKWLPKYGFRVRSLNLAPKDAAYDGAAGLMTWLRTTWLPYIQRVPDEVAQASRLCVASGHEQLTGKMPVPLPSLRDEFITAVAARYVARHPPDADGKVHVRMVRLEIDAVKV